LAKFSIEKIRRAEQQQTRSSGEALQHRDQTGVDGDMQRRALLLALFLPCPAPALAQEQRRGRPGPRRPGKAQPPAVLPPIDPAPRGDLAPVPDRRFPTPAQAAQPGIEVIPAVPRGSPPVRGSSFLDRDLNPEALGRQRDSLVPNPGVTLRVPLR